MNKRQIVASLNKIANELDTNGLYKEANLLTNIMKRLTKTPNDITNVEDTPKITPDDIMRTEDIPTRKSPGNQLSQYNDESARIREFLSKTVSEMTEDELPRWIKEKRDRSQNPPKPEYVRPEEQIRRENLDEIYPTFQKQYQEEVWNKRNPQVTFSNDFKATDFTRGIIREFLSSGESNLNKWINEGINHYNQYARDWFKETQNFNFLIDNINFIQNFMETNSLDNESMEILINHFPDSRKIY
jgi:hypothetical protein